MKPLMLLLLAAMAALPLYGQQYSSTNKKAIPLFEQALSKYGAQSYTEAEALADKAIKLDANFIEAYWLKADIAAKTGNHSLEISALESAASIQPKHATTISGLADAYLADYQNENALSTYKRLLSLDRVPEKYQKAAHQGIETASFRIDAMKNPLPIETTNLGINVNTQYNDYFPSLSADGNTLVYTIELPQTEDNPLLPHTQEDIYITRRTNGGPWQPARSIGAAINSTNNEGAPFLCADGRTLLYTSCTCPDGMIRCCDIYLSSYRDGEFIRPKALGSPINTDAWESQPCMSPDMQTMYFVSNRKGGYGGKDIWRICRQPNGSWGNPENLGPEINTPLDEQNPFIHADNQTLYFTSNGHVGMGGQDLFVSRLINDSTWSEPHNLGYPINTRLDEGRMAVSVEGSTAVMAADRGNGKGLDLYEFTMPPSIRPHRTILVCASILSCDSHQPIQAQYQIYRLSDGKNLVTDISGLNPINSLFYLPQGEDYGISVYKQGYSMLSARFSLKDVPDTLSTKYIEFEICPIKPGTTLTLRNIFFDTDKYDLKPQSYPELNKLVQYMNLNPSIRIEIGGHTDNAGTEAHNLQLSANRARSIVNYLVQKGIDPSRLEYKGYGSSRPTVPNDSPEHMAQNRRTECRVL